MDIDVDINGCCNCQIQFVEPLLDEVMLKIVEMFSGTSGLEAKALLERQLLDGFFINRGPDKSIGIKYRKSQHTG
jgi:hypothetical protein